MPLSTDQKLNLALAALRGVDLKPKEIVLSRADARRFTDYSLTGGTGMLQVQPYYRQVPIGLGAEKSYIRVDTPTQPNDRAPIGPRSFARWLALPEVWPPAKAAAAPRRRAAQRA